MSTPAALEANETNAFEPLCRRIAAAPDILRAAEVLLDGLALEVKATSNDQNVQRFARRLRAQASSLAAALASKDQTHEG